MNANRLSIALGSILAAVALSTPGAAQVMIQPPPRQSISVPSAPDRLNAVSIIDDQWGGGHDIVTWRDTCNFEGGFELYSRPVGSSAWELVATLSANTQVFFVNGYDGHCEAIQEYRVRAFASSRGQTYYSAYSNVDQGEVAFFCGG